MQEAEDEQGDSERLRPALLLILRLLCHWRLVRTEARGTASCSGATRLRPRPGRSRSLPVQ